MEETEALDFLAEAGQLKRVKRSGWWLAGIPDPESVAEHVFRTAIVGHLLARMQGIDPFRVILMILYHDLPETRLNDIHRMGRRYLDPDRAEARVRSDQLPTDPVLGGEIAAALEEFDAAETPEAIVARDADLLECVLQGKEYLDSGFAQASEWCSDKLEHLRTESARKLYARISGWESSSWRREIDGTGD